MVKCKDYIIAKVLIDDGSTFNMLSKNILDHLPVDALDMCPSNMMVCHDK
jgi:hypothetical protein